MAKTRIFLLLGPETGEKERFIQDLQKSLTAEFQAPPEVLKVYPYDMDMNTLVSRMKNQNLFAAHNLIILNNVHELKKKDLEPIIAYCGKPSDETTLIMTTTATQVDAKLTKAVPKSQTKIFWELFSNQKRSWLTGFFRQRNLKITPEGIDLILEMVENDTAQMKEYCEKLALFFPPETLLTEENIENYLYHSKEENVFSLFDRIAQGQFSQAVEVLKKLFASGTGQPIGLLSGLIWQFRRLLNYQRILENGGSSQSALLKAGIRGKTNQNLYISASRRYNKEDIKAIIALTAKYDGQMRETPAAGQPLLMEMYLYYVIKKKGLEPEPYSE